MTYNIHPILVHFPIALLFIYSVIKILPFKKWMPKISWTEIERALLVFGVLGAFAALATGDTAEHLFRPDRALVEMHSTFASIATWLYGALLLGEIITVFTTSYTDIYLKIKSELVKNILVKLQNLLCHKNFAKVIAFFGFIAITVTGLLGGVMVYGASADPLANIVLKILGINL